MKKNIFEAARRGDKFRTRNGELAIYLGSTDDRTSYLIYEDNQIRTVFNDTGCYNYLVCFANPDEYLLPIDIVSRWEDSENKRKD